jgi:hypothetical protein
MGKCIESKGFGMKIEDVASFINKIEDELPVTEWRINDIDVWPLIRIELFFAIYEYDLRKNESTGHDGKIRRIYKFARDIGQFFLALIASSLMRRGSVQIKKVKCDALFFDDPSYIKVDGKYYQRFCDPMIKELRKYNKSSLVMTLRQDCFIPLTTPTNFIWGELQLRRLAGVCKAVFSKGQNLDFYLPGLDQYNERMLSVGRGAPQISLKKLVWEFSIFSEMVDYFDRVIKKTKPSAGFVVCYYDSYHMAFINACRKNNIPSVDIQHGVIHHYHMGYGSWNKVPKAGYNILPDYFSCWDENSAEYINAWSKKQCAPHHEAVVIGNRYLQEIISRSDASEDIFQKYFSKVQDEISPEKNVLLTVQNKVLLTNILKRMLSISPQGFFWWVRLHPMTTESEKDIIVADLSEIKGLKYEVEISTISNLYKILPHMDAHVTLNSSVVIEGLSFGVTSVICDEVGFAYYDHLIKSGKIFAAYDANEIIAYVSELTRVENVQTNTSSDLLYKKIGLS